METVYGFYRFFGGGDCSRTVQEVVFQHSGTIPVTVVFPRSFLSFKNTN